MMRLLVFLLVVLVLFTGVSIYQEWLVVSSDNAGGKLRYIFAIDTDKFHADVARARGTAEPVHEHGHGPQEVQREPAPPVPPAP